MVASLDRIGGGSILITAIQIVAASPMALVDSSAPRVPRVVGIATAVVGMLAAMTGTAIAQGYPMKPVRVIVPFAPGGSTDVIARVVGQKMAEDLGQQLVIDNRPGAASNIGTEIAARAAPDGYALLMGTPGLAINPSLYAGVKFDPVRDFSPIVLMASVPLVFVVHPSLPTRNVQQLVMLAKKHPAALSYASNGSSTHLTAELFQQHSGISMVHVPYKGSAPATNDLIAGHVQVAIDNILSATPHVMSGKLRALAVTTKKRASSLPETPTLAESGYRDFEASSWFGLLGPAGMSKDLIDPLNASANKALRAADVRERLARVGAEVIGGSPEQLGSFVASEFGRWARLIKDRNIKAN